MTEDNAEKVPNQENQTHDRETIPQRVERVANIIMAIHHYKTISGKKSDDILVYDGIRGVYYDDGQNSIRTLSVEILGSQWSTHLLKEITAKIAIKTVVDRSEFDADPELLCCANGILNMSTGELTQHTDKTLFRRCVNASYDPTAECNYLEHYLKQVVQPQDAHLIKQIFGYLLISDNRFKKAFILVGRKHGGKTTLMTVMRKFVGDGNYSSLTLQQICDDRFLIQELQGKIANLSPDMPRGSIVNTELFKALTGNDVVRARVFYGTGFDMLNKAKFVFSCNEVPVADTGDDAYYNRFIVIPFVHMFNPGAHGTVTNYADRLTSPEEMSGLLNVALAARRELLADDGFFISQDSIKSRNLYQTWTGSSIHRFMALCLYIGPDMQAAKSRVKEEYVNYCKSQNIPEASEKLFWSTVKQVLGEEIREFRGKDQELEHEVELGDQRVPMIRGISINHNWM